MQEKYRRIDSLADEKEQIAQKLFLLQENFIRKLDQQIEKTEEDKNVQEKCREDQKEQEEQLSEQIGMAGIKTGMKKSKAGGRGGIVASGIGSYFGKDAIANFASMSLGEKRSGLETSTLGTFDSSLGAPFGGQ